MTKQEIFNTVVTALREQNARSIGKDGKCLYRFNGKKCAAGMLIPDDQYEPWMEGHSWGTPSANSRLTEEQKDKWNKLLNSIDHIDFVAALQLIHDNYDPLEWEGEWEELAEEHGLELP